MLTLQSAAIPIAASGRQMINPVYTITVASQAPLAMNTDFANPRGVALRMFFVRVDFPPHFFQPGFSLLSGSILRFSGSINPPPHQMQVFLLYLSRLGYMSG